MMLSVSSICSLQNKHFSHVNLTDITPGFYQHITIVTQGDNTLDCVYTNRREAYRVVPRPHLGLSDYITIMLVPSYIRVLKKMKVTQRTITVWPNDAAPVLQDCFVCTDWQIFREAATYTGQVDLEEYASSVTSYIS